MSKQELETRIAAALTSDSITSTTVNALIEETTASINDSEVAAEEARQLAFDPARSPDPKAARERLENKLFEISRLRTLLPRLQHLASQVRSSEAAAAYAAKRDALQSEGDALEAELIQTYQDCAEQIVSAFARAVAFQDRVRRELPSLPADVDAFRSFDPAIVRLLQNVVLVGADGKRQVWPQRSSTAFAVEFSQSMLPTMRTHPGADWAKRTAAWP
jgi:hypothetical protein